MRLIALISLLLTLTLTLTLTAPAAAVAQPISPLTLDAYAPTAGPDTPPVYSRRALARGVPYVATVQGTLSFYQAVDYVAPQPPFTIVCGKPGAAPLFSSFGGTGRVTEDAQFIFAYPSARGCPVGYRLPHRWLNFQVNDGHGWVHPPLASNQRVTRPLASHLYIYALLGTGTRAGFRLVDTDTKDNYGALRISVRRAAPSDCAGIGYRAFHYPTRADCLARAIGPEPAGAASVKRPLKTNQAPLARVLRNVDVPSSTNQQLPSGVIGAGELVRLQTDGPGAATLTRALTADGYRSGAITRFAGGDLPELTSTAVYYRSDAAARAGLKTEVALATDVAPPGARASTAPAPSPVGAEQVTFTPSSSTGAGGEELLLAAGRYVYSLTAVQAPDEVSAATVSTLLSAAIGHAAPAR